ncbi:MAG: ABC transporter ATP-binding protein, partial [Flavitalea sp.]
DRLFEIVDLEREDKQDTGSIMTLELTGDIIFKEVCFSYAYKDNLFQSLNMVIRNGSITGITGESGCGKSTIIALLQRIYPLNGGSITINDIDIACINIRYLRSFICIAPQQTDLFQGSVMENIAPGEPEPDLQKILVITEKLGLKSFIENLPQRFNTQLQEQGSNLSGGQRQRISIARAIYQNPSILIMDEATAGLDTLAECQALETLKWLKLMGKTIIIISHKASTLSCCDTVIKLEKGSVTEEGRPYPANTDENFSGKY